MEAILGFDWFGLMKIYPMPAVVIDLIMDTVIKLLSNVFGYPTGYV
jgi:hypothetical protein